MKKIVKEGIKIEFDNNIPEEEINKSFENLKGKILNKTNQTIVLKLVKRSDGIYLKEVIRTDENIQRLRRITGYLTNSLERWNDAKQSEEHDRVKHSLK